MSTNLKRCLGAYLCVFVAQVAFSQALQNSIALTVAPGQTEIGSFELTIPAMVKTTTEVSMVTVTQVSVQTTTVSELTTVSGLCAASSTLTLATSSAPAAINQAASSPLQTLVSLPSIVVQVAPITSDISAAGNGTLSTATPSNGVQILNASSKQCQCQCLCPASAFQAYGSMVASPAISMSTFQTVTALVTAGQRNPSLVISAPSSLVTSSSSPPAIPGDSSISQSTNSLMDVITVPLNVRDLKPTGIRY